MKPILEKLTIQSAHDAMARGDILQVVVFATFFGVAVASIGAAGKPIVEVMESTAQAMFAVTRYVMWFAPIGVFAAIGATRRDGRRRCSPRHGGRNVLGRGWTP